MRGQLVSKADFHRGVNLGSAPYSLEDGEGRDARNFVSTVRGALRKRDGAQTLATVGTTLTSLFAALNPNFLIGAGGTVLYSISPAGVVTTIKTGMTNANRWEWILAPANGGQGPLYGMNGVDNQQWDGVAASTSAWTAATGALPAGAKYLLYHGLRVWAAGMSSYAGVSDPGSTVVASNLANPRDWPAANVYQFDPNDGEAISGIGSIGPYVLVFKPSKMWLIYDLDIGANRRIGANVGAVAHRSIVETPFGTFFLGKDRIYRTDGSAVKQVSDERVQPLLDKITAGTRANAAAGFRNGRYYLSIPTSGGANDVTLDHDVQLDSWWPHTLAESQWASWEPSGSSFLYGAKGGSAIVDRAFVPGELQDNAAPFSCFWNSPFYTFGDPLRKKRIRLLHFDGKGRIQISLARTFAKAAQLVADVNFAAAGDGVYGTNDGNLFGVNDLAGIFGGAVDVAEARVLTPGVARAWSVVVGNTTADQLEIDSINFAITGRKN
jgi:hypothetical protein